MIRFFSKRFALLSSVVVSLALPGGVLGFSVFSVGGNNAASIQPTVDSFRAALGEPNNGNAPGTTGGRREINWDGGGGVSATALAGTPFNGFLNTRGAQFTTPGTGFIQATPEGFATQFGNPSLSTSFADFSPLRIFSAIDSNITDIGFFIPGPNAASQPATVRGFGAVFTDVDLPGSTSIEFFDIHNTSIFSRTVLPGTVPNGSFSFLGVFGDAGEQISRVRITSGNAPIGPNAEAGGVDLVAMDDFIYSEPRAVPESGGIVLMVLGLGSVLFFYRPSLAVS
jgi:hypothetical protein